MKKEAAISIVFCAAFAARAALPTGDAFQNPGHESRPETWFHFIGGNISKEGISADLEAVKSAGIGGIHLFHGQFGGAWPRVPEQVACLSEKWDSLVGFAADECKRLGLDFTMQNCPGWATAGGPWIKPGNAMRHLVWERIDVEGGGRVSVKLPRRTYKDEAGRDYRDIAVIAFPAPEGGDWATPLEPANGRSGKITIPDGERTTAIDFEFDSPVTVRTLELPPVRDFSRKWCYRPGARVSLKAEGKTILEKDLEPSNWHEDHPVTFAIDETTARRFTVELHTKHGATIGEVKLYGSAHADDWEARSGRTLRRFMDNPPRRQSEDAWVKTAQVRDVTQFMKPDGSFEWDAPAGKWSVVRIGHVNTMKTNGPAPKEATGFECDKLSAKGADEHFANYIGRLSKEGGPLHGKIKAMLIDSWECRRQTWTEGLDKIFEKETGYGILPRMPAIMGYVIDSPEETARFLDDWRGFVAKRISDCFYGRMAENCRKAGLGLVFETSFGGVLAGDPLEYYKHADVPMCEFWQPMRECDVGSREFCPVKPTVSAAHIYGKKRVAAEAFTSFDLTWDEKLRDLKHVANVHMAEGVSHMVFHTFTHNPQTDFLPPGTSFGAKIGTPFLRGQTWWGFMPEFTEYLARCQTMLEAGVPVRDVLWYLGDETNHRPDQDAAFPEGRLYDYCNPDALLTRFEAGENGDWRTPDGVSYKVLWIPQSGRMLPETMEKIARCVEKGCVAAFAALPSATATLRPGADAKFAAALATLRSLAEDGRKGGKGRLYTGRTLDSVLLAEGIIADARADGILFDHRHDGDADWYFIVPAGQGKGFKGEVVFRNAAAGVEIWDPQTGGKKPAEARRSDGNKTLVTLDLAPGETVFVVFSASASKPVPPRRDNFLRKIPVGGWTLSFTEGWGMPASMEATELEPWKDLGATPEAKAYSGTAVYKTTFTISQARERASAGSRFTLDLGRVESLAKVKVNGRMFKPVWSQPYKVDITDAVRDGENELEVEATDTWRNRLVYDAGQPEARRKTWTIAGPRAGAPLVESGLLGPVEIVETRSVKARPLPRPALAKRLKEGPEVISIVHWGPTTYTDKEWGYGDVPPSKVAPSDFSAEQIVGACKDGGIEGVVLVCKHHDGFCLWPTKTTDYNISHSKFRDGKGDYVKEIEQACRKAGLKFGVYVSPWDRNNEHYGTGKYVEIYHNQYKELCGGAYGEVFEAWFDGANGGDGWYGGAKNRRKIGKDYYRFDVLHEWLRKAQPGITLFAGEDDDSDFRWPGNEGGYLAGDSRATVEATDGFLDSKYGNTNYWNQINTGAKDGDFFRPGEADFPLRPGWVWHKRDTGKSKTSAQLMKRYLWSVGNGGTMNIGVSPDLRGRVCDEDVEKLAGFRRMKEAMFANEATGPGAKFNVVVLEENLDNGEQVDGWKILADGREILSGKSIGRKRIRILAEPVAPEKCELVITADGGSLLPVAFKRYYADPEIVKAVNEAR